MRGVLQTLCAITCNNLCKFYQNYGSFPANETKYLLSCVLYLNRKTFSWLIQSVDLNSNQFELVSVNSNTCANDTAILFTSPFRRGRQTPNSKFSWNGLLQIYSRWTHPLRLHGNLPTIKKYLHCGQKFPQLNFFHWLIWSVQKTPFSWVETLMLPGQHLQENVTFSPLSKAQIVHESTIWSTFKFLAQQVTSNLKPSQLLATFLKMKLPSTPTRHFQIIGK